MVLQQSDYKAHHFKVSGTSLMRQTECGVEFLHSVIIECSRYLFSRILETVYGASR